MRAQAWTVLAGLAGVVGVVAATRSGGPAGPGAGVGATARVDAAPVGLTTEERGEPARTMTEAVYVPLSIPELKRGRYIADLTKDGFLDVGDVARFMELMARRDSGADFNHDGRIDARDATAYLAAFQGATVARVCGC